tara:strand:- start:9517 stop:11040 length:1524 start_codon:yes stop_codon:yes gene_type:complete
MMLGTLQLGGCKKIESKKIHEPIESEAIVITGEVIPGTGTKDTVTIQFGSVIPFNRKYKVQQESLKLDRNHKFSFKATPEHPVERFSLACGRNYPDTKNLKFNDGLREYFMSPGDSIHITIDHSKAETQVRFSGKGSAKCQVRWESDQMIRGDQQTKTVQAYRRIFKNYGKGIKRKQQELYFSDSLIIQQLRLIEPYKKDMKALEMDVLKADIIGATKSRFFSMDNTLRPETMTTSESDVYKLLIEEACASELTEQAMALSPFYVDFLNRMAIAELVVDNPGDSMYHFSKIYLKHFGLLCSLLRERYTGLLREKLLIYNLQNMKVQDTYGLEECLQTSYDLIQNTDLKAIIEMMYGRKMRGATAYNFSLPDVHGNMVNLEDFKGKVVYLDIWFTGCGGCLHLAEEVDKEVYPKFKNNPDVVFLTVCMDKQKETWLKSVATEKYCLKEYVNLYSEGLGKEHPFLQYYQVQGGPTTMLIDRQGRIYSAAPPKHDASAELVALIEEALDN